MERKMKNMKLFSKIATALVGMAMAVGVGVAVGSTKVSEVRADDTTVSLDFSTNSYGVSATQGNQTLTGDGATYGFEFGKGTGSGAKYDSTNKYVLFGKAGVYFRNTSAPSDSYISAISWTYSGSTSTNVQLSLSLGASALTAESSPDTSFGKASKNGTVSLDLTDESVSYFFIYVTNAYNCQITSFSVTWSPNSGPATYYTVTDNVEHGSLNKSTVKEGTNLVTAITPDSGFNLPESVSVTMGGVAATITYADGVVTLNNVTGDVVISATCPAKHGYSADDPFTVAEAIAEIDSVTTANNAFVQGIISQVDSYNSTYKSIQYWISDDGTTTTQLECYSGKGLNGADFAAKEDVEVGATVVVTGTLKKYNTTYEFDKSNYQVSYVPPVHEDPTLSLSSYKTQLVNGGDSFTITASYESFSGTPTLSVDGTPAYVNVSVAGSTVTLSGKASGSETLTLRATYNTEVATKEFKVVVTTNAGTNASPFTVAEAKMVIDVMENVNGSVVGIISQVDSYDSSYKSITYWISDDGTTTSQLECYSGNGFDGANFSSKDDLVTGTKVVVNGTLKLYNTTYEFDKKNKIVAFPNVDAFAQEILTKTDAVCEDYDGVTNNHDAIAAIWETLSGADYYGKLTSTESAFIASVSGKEDGSTVEQAMARYDYLTIKYELDNFITGRTPSVGAAIQPINNSSNNLNSTTSIVVVAVIAITSLSAIGVLLVIKRRKSI